jgi:hypothetical protein
MTTEGNISKARKTLPSMDVDAVDSANVIDHTAPAAPQVDYAPKIAELEASLEKANQTARIGVAGAAAAFVLALTVAWWQPSLVDNDLSTRQTTLLATSHLRQLASHSAPFAADMALLSKVLPKDSDIDDAVKAIEPLAATGVPTVAELRDKFRGTADQVLVGKVVAKNDQSWWNWGVHKIASAIRVEAVADAVVPPSADLREVHDADAALKDNDLKGAVEHLAKLDGSAGEVVRGWLAEARARVELDEAVAKLAGLAEARAATGARLR